MMRGFVRSESGASIIEFAFIAPFLIFLFMGLVELGRYAYYAILAAHAARAAVAYGSQNLQTAEDFSGMRSAAAADAANLSNWTATGGAITPQYLCSVSGSAVGACPSNGSSPPANTVYYVKVTVTGTFHTLLRYPGLPDQVQVSGSALTRVGGQ